MDLTGGAPGPEPGAEAWRPRAGTALKAHDCLLGRRGFAGLGFRYKGFRV